MENVGMKQARPRNEEFNELYKLLQGMEAIIDLENGQMPA